MNELTREDIVLIIEGLRLYQAMLAADRTRAAVLAEELGRPVTVTDTVAQIDALCERLNCG